MDANTENTFTAIYTKKEWKSSFGTESGPGSTKQIAKKYFSFLTTFVKSHNICTILDLGCGDFNLMKHFDFTGVYYTGVDTVKFVVDKNIAKHSAPNINFIHADIVSFVPEYSYDLVILKDVLQHLNNEQVLKTIKNITYTKFLLTHNDLDRSCSPNKLICTGGCRSLNLQKAPFNFKTHPVLNTYTINEYRRTEIILPEENY